MSHPFDTLTPDLVLDAVESLGYLSDARVLALNSYENRVYQVGIEDSTPLIAKFYRPHRWSDAAILEEHRFSLELAEREIPVVAPLERDGQTLHTHAGFRFALFPRRGGRAPEPGNLDQLYRLGQLLGRMHAVSASHPFEHRETLGVENFGHASLSTLLDGGFVPRSLLPAYESVARDLLKRVEDVFARTDFQPIRLHGDCHPGNILARDDAFYLVDLDDCRMGPSVQDIWMMLAGERHERLGQLSELVEGYNEFHDFTPRELPLIEALRALRLLHYSAWLARRWDAGVNERIDQHPDGLVEQLAALPHRLRLGHPATQRPAVGHPEKAYGRGDHGHSILLEAPTRTRHVRRGGHQHDTFDTLRLEHRRTVHRIFPGGATALLLPADRRGEIALQRLGGERRLARRLTIVQSAAGQDRQLRGLCQARGITQALQRDVAGLVGLPGGVGTFPTGTQHDDGLGLLAQARPLRLGYRRFALQRLRRPLHHDRQAHQPQTSQADDETQG